jgi:hypothetical protein
LTEADAALAYDRLVGELRSTVIPNFRRLPRIGRRYLEQPPQSAEAISQLAALPAGAADRLREYLHGDHLILYTVATAGQLVHLLSIRQHRKLSFQPSRLRAGPGCSPER